VFCGYSLRSQPYWLTIHYCSLLASENYLVTEFCVSIYRRKTEIPSSDLEYKFTRLKKQYNFSATSYPVAVKFWSDGLPRKWSPELGLV
jgi:hypothetical protein